MAISQSTERPYATARAATALTVLTVLSPIAGLMVEMTLAWRFGASTAVDAFRIASLILLLGNQLFFGQLLPNVVVPLVCEYRAKGIEREGWRLAFSFGGILGFVSFIFVIWVWLNPDILIGLLGPGLADSGKADAILLIRYFSLAFVLMVWSGVIGGVLYAYRIFWQPAASQLLTNLFVIAAIFSIGSRWGSGSVALGVLLGSFVMFVLHLYFLGHIANTSGIRLLACMKLGAWRGVIKAVRLSLPLIGMIFISQWSIIIINRTLSELPSGTLANFGYAYKLLMLVGILPASLATVIFPTFSEAQAHNNSSELSRSITRAIRMTLLLTMPLSVVLFVDRFPLVSLLFDRGVMSSNAVAEISQLFGVLVMGAPAGALMAILYKVSFSVQDTKSPAIATFISALVITWLVPFASGIAGASGVAWTSTAISWASVLGLLAYQVWRYRALYVWEMIRYFGLLAIVCTVVMMSAMAMRTIFKLADMPMAVTPILLEISVITVFCMVIGYAISQWIGIGEASEICEYLWWQVRQPLARFTSRSQS
jgi:putative peptidoglycan lipid II flippase